MAHQTALYELSGRALEAAQRLEAEVQKELQTVRVMRKGRLDKIQKSWQKMYDGLLKRLEQEAPEILEALGLKSPSVVVYQGPNTFPRAYQEYADVFSSCEKNPRYFMYVPVDYQGNHFAPPESRLVTGKEVQNIGDLLFAGGWSGNAPLASIPKEGVATPEDYALPASEKSEEGMPKKLKEFAKKHFLPVHFSGCFAVSGRSADLVEAFKARRQIWEARLKEACAEIEKEVLKKKEDILVHLPKGEDVRISASYRYREGEKPETLLSVRRAGKLNIFDSGKPVLAPVSPAYLLEYQNGGDYIVKPRLDTPEGQKIAELIDAVPVTPSLCDYTELCPHPKTMNASLTVFEGLTFLTLRNLQEGKKQKDFCPPHATPVPEQVYQWLLSDANDKRQGIKCPPRPPEVTQFIASLKREKQRNPKQEKQREPKPKI